MMSEEFPEDRWNIIKKEDDLPKVGKGVWVLFDYHDTYSHPHIEPCRLIKKEKTNQFDPKYEWYFIEKDEKYCNRVHAVAWRDFKEHEDLSDNHENN